ncbi:MAG: S8 family serine peptidase, partial [Caldilineaceae bacterium]|nr:S8 family serine peptidase [Caldilineaceae bacterium]
LLSPGPLFAEDTPAAPIDSSTATQVVDAYPGEILVGVPADAVSSAASTLDAMDAHLLEQTQNCGNQTVLQVWQVAAGQESQALAALAGDPRVQFAVPNAMVYAAQDQNSQAAGEDSEIDTKAESAYAVDDRFYAGSQWDMQRSYFVRAWRLISLSGVVLQPVRVAVIDSGIDAGHPEFSGHLLPGYNYVTPGAAPNDDYGHGTHVSGVIGALTNNGLGIAGGAFEVSIDARKMLDANGSGSVANLIQAICDAADSGARVINMSLEIPTSLNPVLVMQLDDATSYAYSQGALPVAAAGNLPRCPTVCYPAKLNSVMAVSALTINNKLASYSAVGPEVELGAGGGDSTAAVLSTWPAAETVRNKCVGVGRYLLSDQGSWYCGEYGTSMAAPHVSAAAALLWSIDPTLTVGEMRTLLRTAARPIGLPPNQAGSGLLDVEMAVRQALSGRLHVDPTVVGMEIRGGAQPVTTTVVLSNASVEPVMVTGSTAGLPGWLTVANLPTKTFSTSVTYGDQAYLSLVISPTVLPAGVYNASLPLTATGASGTPVTQNVRVSLNIDGYPPGWYLPLLMTDGYTDTLPSSPPSPVDFAWETPIMTPTNYLLGENGTATVQLPFAFPATGPELSATYEYTEAVIYADGFLQFPGPISTIVSDPADNGCLPTANGLDQGILGWWADLNPGASGAEVSTFPAAPDRFVVQFKNVPSGPTVSPGYRVSFQMVLYANGDIRLNYLEVPPLSIQGISDLQRRVTVGAQARAGLFHNEVACFDGNMEHGVPPQALESVFIERKEIY